jgi:Uma2 family endonuclease
MAMTAQRIQPIFKDTETDSNVSNTFFTLSEYIKREERSSGKHEFNKGVITKTSGKTPLQAQIAANFGTFLNVCLFKKTENFIAYNSNAQIYIPELDKSLYADVSAVAGSPILYQHYKTLIINPLLIVEVLSVGTEKYDKNGKFEFYQKIPTFKEYVLVHQDQPKVEIYYCKNGNRNVWIYSFATGLDASVKLQSIGCTLRLKDIYRNIVF